MTSRYKATTASGDSSKCMGSSVSPVCPLPRVAGTRSSHLCTEGLRLHRETPCAMGRKKVTRCALCVVDACMYGRKRAMGGVCCVLALGSVLVHVLVHLLLSCICIVTPALEKSSDQKRLFLFRPHPAWSRMKDVSWLYDAPRERGWKEVQRTRVCVWLSSSGLALYVCWLTVSLCPPAGAYSS